jgi:uncharacterized protein with HEPN domain
MLTAARRAVDRLGQTSFAEFERDTDLQWVMFSQIVLLCEAATRTSLEYRNELPEIPWSAAISMRNRIVHGYDSIDWRIVFDTITMELPTMIIEIEGAVRGSQ